MDILPANTQSDYIPEQNQQAQSPNPAYAPAGQQTMQSNIAQNMQIASQQAKETGIIPEFSIRAVQNMFKSNEEGRPIYDEIEWINIRVAGDRNMEVSRKVNETDKIRFAAYYTAFQAGEKMSVSGTPLEHWPAISRGQVAELKHLNIATVEALAQISDQGIANIGMGGREMVVKAQAYLEAAKTTAIPQHLAAENERMKNDMEMLKRQIAEMGAATKDYSELKTQVESLHVKNSNLETQVATLQTENAALQSKATATPKPKAKAKSAPKPKADPS